MHTSTRRVRTLGFLVLASAPGTRVSSAPAPAVAPAPRSLRRVIVPSVIPASKTSRSKGGPPPQRPHMVRESALPRAGSRQETEREVSFTFNATIPFVEDAEAREQVAAASRKLAQEGLVLGTAGNVSARIGDRVAISPTGA